MWEINALILAGLSLVLTAWLIALLIRLRKIKFRFRQLAKENRQPDRTSRDLSFEELKERVRGLESGWSFFFEESPICNVSLDRSGRIRDLNRSFLNIFDREKADLQGRLLLDLAAEAARGRLAGYLKAHQVGNYTSEEEFEFTGPRGSRWILFGERHLTTVEKGLPTGVIISGVDVTDRKRVEADGEELKSKLALSVRMEALGIMAGGIAHDLKNLFNPVLSYPDYIADKLPPESDLQAPVRRIKRAASQAAELVQNFLSLARRGRLDLRPLDLNAVVSSYIQSMGFKTLEDRFPRARIILELAPVLPPVSGLSPQLISVLMNLVRNGCEALEEGGEIRISTYPEKLLAPRLGRQQIPRGEYAVLKVADTGKGMGREELDRIFAPFRSGKEMGSSGTGLGMAVVVGVIEDHHGYIDVVSEPGRGTEIMIYLRAAEADEAGPAGGSGTGERILVVDDSEDDRRELVRELAARGYEVASASDGDAALKYVREDQVDLIVMDLALDRESGLDLYRRILEITPGAKCVLISGVLDYQARARAAALGVAGYLEKPAAPDDLARLVRAELEK